VLRMPGERYLTACVVPIVKFGGGSITVWGVLSWNGLRFLIILHRNLNAEECKGILTMIENQFGDDDCLYQHDNAPSHKTRSVMEWFLDWPAQNPDLTPTEHLWDESECRLRYRPQCPTSLTALATAL
jgi:hypothetical protein